MAFQPCRQSLFSVPNYLLRNISRSVACHTFYLSCSSAVAADVAARHTAPLTYEAVIASSSCAASAEQPHLCSGRRAAGRGAIVQTCISERAALIGDSNLRQLHDCRFLFINPKQIIAVCSARLRELKIKVCSVHILHRAVIRDRVQQYPAAVIGIGKVR